LLRAKLAILLSLRKRSSYGVRKMPSHGSKTLVITKVSLKRKGDASLKKIAKRVKFFDVPMDI